jgi:hypothetical protein
LSACRAEYLVLFTQPIHGCDSIQQLFELSFI